MAERRNRILVVDDEAHQRAALASMLTSWGYEALTAQNGAVALDLLGQQAVDAIVTDLMMPVLDGAGLLKKLNEQGNSPPAIVLTAFGNLETALAMVHDLHAFWFLEKPLQPPALRILLERAISQTSLSRDNERLKRELQTRGVLDSLVGESAAMQEVFSLISQVAPTPATVLVTGESGTGKELAARALHNLSPRSNAPFVAVNCAALTETLIESELFGHEKGAFTGAVERRRGCFELATGGTLFLDEIGEMPLATQAKLLRVLEERRVRRLGMGAEIAVDIRLVAATNRPLEETVRDGKFREDLFFRLNVFQVWLPPLRTRKDDIEPLCAALLRDLNTRYQCRVMGLSPAALAKLQGHDWPGNVRELRNALERAVILAGEGVIQEQHLPRFSSASAPAAAEPSGEQADAATLTAGMTVEDAERMLVDLTLRHTKNNRTRAAALLGVSQKTLYNKLRAWGSAAEDECP